MDLLWQLEGIRSPFWDTVFGLITRLGEEMILILVFCILFWCVNKRMAYVMGISFFLSSLVVQGAKIVFRVARPWIYDPTFAPVGGALQASTGYAFPSGHTQNAAALLGSLGALLKPKAVKIILFALVILVAFSRMYLGVHFLSDVVASLAITFLIIWFAAKVVTEEPASQKRELLLALFLIFAAVVVITIATILYHNGATTPAQLRDSTRAAGAAIGFAVGMYVERMYIRFSVRSQNLPVEILKVVLGIAGVLAIQEGVRLIGTGLVINAVRYFLMVSWLTLVYPLIIKRFFTKREHASIP